MHRGRAPVFALACAGILVLAGCSADEPADPATIAATPNASPAPQITAATTPPVANLDLEAWAGDALPDRGPDAVRSTGQLSPTAAMDPVDVSVASGTGTLDIACAGDAAAVVHVTLTGADGTVENDVSCAVGVAERPAVLTVEYPAGDGTTVQLSTISPAVYIVQASHTN